MATSNTFNTSNTHVKYSIEVNTNSQNIAGNSSNITVNVWFWRDNSGYTTYGSGTCYCGINDSSYSQSVTSSQKLQARRFHFSQKLWISVTTMMVQKTIWVSASISLNTPLSSDDQGFNVTLSTIPRAATCTGADNFNDEQNPKIYFNNLAVLSFA